MRLSLQLLWQYVLNWINLADHALNVLLLGDCYETVSARVGRAKNSGVYWAIQFDCFLTFCQKILTDGKETEDHGEYALDPKVVPNSREILDLCHWPPKFRLEPVNTVLPSDIGENNEIKK